MRDADGGSVMLPVILVGGTVVALAAMRPRNVATDVAGGRTSTEEPVSRGLWVWHVADRAGERVAGRFHLTRCEAP